MEIKRQSVDSFPRTSSSEVEGDNNRLYDFGWSRWKDRRQLGGYVDSTFWVVRSVGYGVSWMTTICGKQGWEAIE